MFDYLIGMKRSNFPIIILTKDDGTKLLKALKEHRDHGVLACIDAESDVDVKPPSVSRNTKALTFTETGGKYQLLYIQCHVYILYIVS